ncbi:MAG: LUD domain-containing protein [Flavitalea sp.]
MSSRTTILAAINNNKPTFIKAPAPQERTADIDIEALLSTFIHTLKSIGGEAVIANSYEEIKTDLLKRIPAGAYLVNTIPGLGRVNGEVNAMSGADTLGKVERACIAGAIGVAENGAVWVDEAQMVNRLLPFICQHLSLVINAGDIVSDMHQAYDRINIAKEGYGAFIAGPSKTADIEQSLVIGAHGARSLIVYLIKNN